MDLSTVHTSTKTMSLWTKKTQFSGEREALRCFHAELTEAFTPPGCSAPKSPSTCGGNEIKPNGVWRQSSDRMDDYSV